MSARTIPFRWSAIAFLFTLGLNSPIFGQNVPLQSLDNWMWYNENGWNDIERGWYDRAEQKFNMAIKEIQPYAPANRRLMARTYCDLARVLYYQKRYAEAEPLAKWALSVRDADKKSAPDSVFQGLFTLAAIQLAQDHYADAEPHLKRALTIQEKELTGGHVNLLFTLDRLAFALRGQGKYHEAEPLYLRAIAIHERNAPDENLDLADTIEQYVILLRKLNRKRDAEIWQARALTIRDTVATNEAKARLDQVTRKLRGFK
jgi:tetratricopeptide (TPR) repeat protein